MTESKGQALILKVAAWLESYLVFPNEHYALVAALWALNTHFFEVFDAVPYLAVTAATKRAGKTTLLELLSFLSRNAERIGAGTMAATIYSLIESHDARCALFFDEAERMSSGQATVMRALMNQGYRRGETVPRKGPDGEIIRVRCFGPKLFALIGDPTETLRDRSILFVLRRAVSQRPYRPTTAAREAEGLVHEIREYVKSGALASMAIVAPEWLENRDQEIWEPLWSLVLAAGCDKAVVERFQRASSFCVAGKGAEIKRFVEHEETIDAETYGEKAIRDLLSVLRGDEPAVFSAVAVERMRGIPTAPWANYKGEGLTENKLADLVSPFGVHPKLVRMVGGRGAKTAKVSRGYSRKDLQASGAVPEVGQAR